MVQDEQDAYRMFLRLAQASQNQLEAGWLATPAASADADVPATVARVQVAIENLRDQLGEVLLAAPPAVGSAAQDLCRVVRYSAGTQIKLHIQNRGRTERLVDLDPQAFRLHMTAIRVAREVYIQAVRQRRASIAAAPSDAASAIRVMRAAPADAAWLTTLSQRMRMNRIPHTLDRDVREALDRLSRPDIRFADPELVAAHQGLVAALVHLVDEFDGTYAPDAPGPVKYTEVPPEWKWTDPSLYYQTVQVLSQARDTVLARYEEMMNVMSSTGNLPAPQDPPPAQNFNVTSGDNSPVNVNAAFATGSGTAHAGASPASQPSTPAPGAWYRSTGRLDRGLRHRHHRRHRDRVLRPDQVTWPFRRELQPLDRLERGVLDDSTSLAGLLRHALIIAGHASSEPLQTWALNELKGYANHPETAFPDYRRIRVPIQADFLSALQRFPGETISAVHLPDFTRGKISEDIAIYFGVGQLESLISRTPEGAPVRISLPGAAELQVLMSAEESYRSRGIVIGDLYWAVSPIALQDIVDQVRTRLTQFVAELRSTMPTGAHRPTPDQVHRAVQHINITTGDNSPVTLAAPMAYAESGSTATAATGTTVRSRWWPWRR
ncbi:AbiTii domain-containing protein [Streptomyces amritsarensis]|uniref:AbiTii domain-containing protein n=1 Tax=Streptomyces amritsarensis TaxID=681158 RepID=UPI0036CA8D66